MSVSQYLLTYMTTAVIFFAIDMVWLGFISASFYRRQMGELRRANVNWGAGIAFYALYVAGIIFFVINPALEADSWVKALSYGAFLGLLCYSTYDLTSLAVVKNWSVKLTFIDIAWGALLTGFVSLLSYFVVQGFVV